MYVWKKFISFEHYISNIVGMFYSRNKLKCLKVNIICMFTVLNFVNENEDTIMICDDENNTMMTRRNTNWRRLLECFTKEIY